MFFVLIGGALCLPACTASFLDLASRGIFQRQDVNVTEKSYAAADYLIERAGGYVSKKDRIEVQPLLARDNPDLPSEFAKAIPEQIGSRISQLGYRVDIAPVRVSADVPHLGYAESTGAPDYLLGGTYATGRQDVAVYLRITEARTGRVVGVFDYTMPLTRDIAALTETQPRIFRVENDSE
ncbi:MAG: hypothetical protein K9G62_08880 [Alphaproteobacteria bacterium]|nr:hypothetical protein [Alphaproteobacteria bacterium]